MDDKALLAAIENIMDKKLEPINTRLDRLEQGQEQMREDIVDLKQGQEQLKQGQEQIREDIADVKLDIKLLWEEAKIINKRIALHEKEWHSA